MLTLDQRAEISELLEDGLTFREVGRRIGVSDITVRRFAREIDDEATAYLPSEEEIEAERQKIQARWSDEERERRRMGRLDDLTFFNAEGSDNIAAALAGDFVYISQLFPGTSGSNGGA